MNSRITRYMPNLFMAANWSKEKDMAELFSAGLQVGVRGFDTAREYKVEKNVGRALKTALANTGIRREEIFIQTRICNEEIIRGKIKDEVYRSLDKMRVEYLDCFMFHWPTPDYYISAWRELEDLFINDKVVRSIGMCNCRLRHLLQMEKECNIMPHVLQVEVTPFWQINDLKEYCDIHDIYIQAFSPLCKMIEPIRENNVLKSLSDKYNVSIPQIILRWNYQRGIRPISLSSKVNRVYSNFDIWDFELSKSDMQMIASIDCGYKYHLESATCAGF